MAQVFWSHSSLNMNECWLAQTYMHHTGILNVLLIIKRNFATEGGGIYLEANSRLIIPKNIRYRLIFEHNGACMFGPINIHSY